ncbi:MAG TPA: hypothetical protein VF173_36260 [Thermoanaerobaculia bacterium]|nr:hypothetical protein [Thermoanaerobaculia bacterium]
MNESELADLFARSRQEEVWPEEPSAAAAIWQRARADELLTAEIERRKRRARPLVLGQIGASLAVLAAAELAVFQAFQALPSESPAFREALASTGFSPLSAALLALVAVPALGLLYRLRAQP